MIVMACNSNTNHNIKAVNYAELEDVPDEVWEKVARMRVLFGHQSVGYNIIDGINDIMNEYPNIRLNIVETRDTSKYDNGVFAHFKVGKNLKPDLKISDFENTVLSRKNKNIDIALLKLCYVDIDKKSDIKAIHSQYKNAVGKIRKKVKVVHFTTPLTIKKETWKTKIKSLLGNDDIWEYASNRKRNDYNEILLREYGNVDKIIDIARIESTYEDGKREAFKVGKKTYYALIKEYTYDQGHLNEVGRKKVAKELLLTIASTLSK